MIKSLNEELTNTKINEYHEKYFNEEIKSKSKMIETY